MTLALLRHVRALRSRCALVMLALALPAMAAAQQPGVTLTTNPYFTPGSPITVSVEGFTMGSGPLAWCLPSEGCYATALDASATVWTANNDFSATVYGYGYHFGGDVVDTTSRTAGVTYYAGGSIVWEICDATCYWYALNGYGYFPYQHVEELPGGPVSAQPGITPVNVGVSPTGQTGIVQTFSLQYSSPAGYADIAEAWALIHPSGSGANSCVFTYTPYSNLIWLWNDEGTGWPNAAMGSGTILENSQCRIYTGDSNVNGSGGNTLVVNIRVAFKPAYSGAKNIYMASTSWSGWTGSGWEQKGTWTVPALELSNAGVTPASGQHLQATFEAAYTDTYGVSDIYRIWLQIAPAVNVPPRCLVMYDVPSQALYLQNDDDYTWMAPGTIGRTPTLQNSRCTLLPASASVTSSGNTLTLRLPVNFPLSFAGTKTVSQYIQSLSGAQQGWDVKGTWAVGCPVPTVTPAQPEVPPVAGELTLLIRDNPAVCAWSADPGAQFLTATSPLGGMGDGEVSYAYTANTNATLRVAQLVVGGRAIDVTQLGAGQLPDDEVVYYHQDAIGSVRLVTDVLGQQLRRHDFAPFGVEVGTASANEGFMFAGNQRDDGLGVDYLNARYLAPATDRFTSPDPLPITERRVFEPYRLNRYTYAAANPLKFVDRSGLDYEICVPGDTCATFTGEWHDLQGWAALQGVSLEGNLFSGWIRYPEYDNLPIGTYDYVLAASPPLGDPTSHSGQPGAQPSTPSTSGGPQCFAQLKYRPVISAPGVGAQNHSFWYVQDKTGKQFQVSATHTTKYLNVKIGPPTTTPDKDSNDYIGASTHWTSGLSSSVCGGVDNLLNAANSYPQDKWTYPFLTGNPNSNTVAHWLGTQAPFRVTAPPNTPYWGNGTFLINVGKGTVRFPY